MQNHTKTFADLSQRLNLSNFLTSLGVESAADLSETLDHAHAGDVSLAPDAQPHLFGGSERALGDPAQIFSHLSTPVIPYRRTTATDEWLELVDNLKPFGVKGQVAGINAFVNNCAHPAEIAYLAKVRLWAKPALCFENTDGAVDVAMAKYVSLRRLDFHPDRLRLVWIRDETDETDHTVLTVTFDGRVFVLDDRYSDIATDEDYLDTQAVCSLNGMRLSLHWNPDADDGAKAALDRLAVRFGIGRA